MPRPIRILPATDTFDHNAALLACAQGDHRALERIYTHEHRYLFGVALRIVRQHQRAEDVLHDAFISIWQRASSFDPSRGEARGWIFSIVRHAALNMVRNDVREVSVDEDAALSLYDQAVMASHATTDDPFERRAELGRLGDCLSGLEPGRRACIVMAYVDGCSHGEIATQTGTPLGTVKAWIQRGMRALRECMG